MEEQKKPKSVSELSSEQSTETPHTKKIVINPELRRAVYALRKQLEGGIEREWGIHDSPLARYAEEFYEVLPEMESEKWFEGLRKYINEALDVHRDTPFIAVKFDDSDMYNPLGDISKVFIDRAMDRFKKKPEEVTLAYLVQILSMTCQKLQEVLNPEGMRFVIQGITKVILFRKYIERTLAGQGARLSAVEFGGEGSNLFSDFSRGFFKKTIGVSLEDRRPDAICKEDEIKNHEVLVGDIFSGDTYRMIYDRLEGKKTNLIISRMYGALNIITDNPIVLGQLMRRWYSLLDENGLMFVQFLSEHIAATEKNGVRIDLRENLFEKWYAMIKEHYSETLEIQESYSCFRLLKKKGAPEILPLLESFDSSPKIEPS
jgi:hypothetical protein